MCQFIFFVLCDRRRFSAGSKLLFSIRLLRRMFTHYVLKLTKLKCRLNVSCQMWFIIFTILAPTTSLHLKVTLEVFGIKTSMSSQSTNPKDTADIRAGTQLRMPKCTCSLGSAMISTANCSETWRERAEARIRLSLASGTLPTHLFTP